MDDSHRDRFLDAARVVSVLIVVAGHWLVLVPRLGSGLAGGRPLYQVDPAFWPLTWAFDVLPLFFFVGGFANYTSYTSPRRAVEGEGFHGRRLRRLLEPTLAFIGAWAVLQAVFQAGGIGAPGPLRGMRIGQITPFESLWFLGVYLGVVLLSPATIALHRRLGWAAPALMLLAIAFCDLLAWRLGSDWLLLPNLALVWLLPHQLGYLYADGRLQRVPGPALLAAAGLALGLAAVLTSLPFYGRDLLDGRASIAGVALPTVPFALAAVWMIALALAARTLAPRLLAKPRVWRAVAALNSIAMTLFLWHMTAYFAGLVLLGRLGLPLPQQPDLTWWLERPVFLAVPLIALIPLIWLFGRFERPPRALAVRAAANA